MSEIKSTLDLVMERTKNLTMNKAEKEHQRKTDLKKRLAGLIQKYDDQAIKSTELYRHLDELKISFGPKVDRQMADEVLKSVDVTVNNRARLELLTGYFGLDVAHVQQILASYRQALDDLSFEHTNQLKSRLQDDNCISGQAVIPNTETDPAWQKARNTLTEQFQKKLESVKSTFASE